MFETRFTACLMPKIFKILIQHRLLDRDGRWAVYDVAVDGVSFSSNYGGQLTSMLKRMSFAHLLDRLRNREASVGPQQVQSR
jgi:hypothetical protein